MATEKSIQTLSRNFVIPAGTQVVLQTAKQILVDEAAPNAAVHANPTFKKPGCVGVVVKCPPHNELEYTIKFTDGTKVYATFDEITLRRQEIDHLLASQKTDWKPFIIYRCQVGSKAFGLATDDSDDDYRGFFLPPADFHWSLFKIPEQIEFNDGQNDEVYWEIEKYIRLALKANPNILETLWTPLVIQTNAIANRLRELRKAFLSKHLYKTYSGYVLSQFRRMNNAYQKTGQYKTKHAMHLLRLLHSGIGAMKTGEIMIDVSDHRSSLLKVRQGNYSFEEVKNMALTLDQQFQSAFEITKLPEQPNFEAVNQFLIDARRSTLNT